MPDDPVIQDAGGLAESHPAADPLTVFVAPGTKGEKNTIRESLIPVGCWKITDIRFQFGSSFILPDSKDEFAELSKLRSTHAGSLMSIFGHADPVGDDTFNKKLSGQRAEVIYALLLHDTARWERIYKESGQEWGTDSVRSMLTALGHADPDTTAAIKDFQSKNGASPTGANDESMRAKLFAAYMKFLWPVPVQKTDFLGRGADAGGKGDMQGCSEFNPAMVFSSAELNSMSTTQRNEQNAVNRRVLILLFHKDAKITVAKWYCPRVAEDTGGCRKRFWSDGEKRRANGAARREFKTTKDTFACRFYQRLVDASPCEVIKPTQPISLKLIKVDDHFCPKNEMLDIEYSLTGLSAKIVKLTISSKHAKSNPLFERELTGPEKTDGTHTIQWDGRATSGDLKDKFLNPLLAPYKVTLFHNATHQGELEFKVLYHSIDLAQAPWTPDEKVPDKAAKLDDWIQYRLNELGYFGGPVGKDFDKYLEKAILRYKVNHKKMHQIDYSTTNATRTDDLKAALEAGDNQRNWLTEPAAITDPAKNSKIRVELVNSEIGESVSSNKGTIEKNKLNRPLIPLEAIVKLKKKDDSAAVCPEAVGAVRINWRSVDANEDVTILPTNSAAEPSQTDKYVEKALKVKNGRAGNGDNAPKEYAGIREGAATNYKTCFQLGDKLLPYKVEDDSGDKVVFSKASIDEAEPNAKRLGRAGVFFRPSYISGDDYKLSAEIDFEGLPNKADLEKFHSYKANDPKSRIRKETGTFLIERFGKVAVNIDWPARTNSYQWTKTHRDFAHAYLDIDVGGITNKVIKDVITEAEYRAVVQGIPAYAAVNVTLRETAFTGLDTPAQTVAAATYRAALRTEYVAFQRAIRSDLGRLLLRKLRPDFPTGFIVVTFQPRVPVDVQQNPAAGQTNVVQAGFIPGALSVSLDDNVILLDQQDSDQVYIVVTHEAGHSYWLQHFENAPGSAPAEHDTDDHNCTMTYPDPATGFPNQQTGAFRSHFCGKCNLKLRGWDVTAAGLPAKSS